MLSRVSSHIFPFAIFAHLCHSKMTIARSFQTDLHPMRMKRINDASNFIWWHRERILRITILNNFDEAPASYTSEKRREKTILSLPLRLKWAFTWSISVWMSFNAISMNWTERHDTNEAPFLVFWIVKFMNLMPELSSLSGKYNKLTINGNLPWLAYLCHCVFGLSCSSA